MIQVLQSFLKKKSRTFQLLVLGGRTKARKASREGCDISGSVADWGLRSRSQEQNVLWCLCLEMVLRGKPQSLVALSNVAAKALQRNQ